MHHHTSPNQPYDLCTEHGRAQSYAHSTHGAMLVDFIEASLIDANDTVCGQVAQLIEKELLHLNPIDSESDDLNAELSIFHAELGQRDAKEFKLLLSAYREQHSAMSGNIRILRSLIDSIRAMFEIPAEELQPTEDPPV